MSTATLKAQVQLRIDALTTATPAIDILQNAVDTVGLDLDLTNITSVLNSATNSISGSTLDDDITALNSASIALGVTSKPSTSTPEYLPGVFVYNQTINAGSSGLLLTLNTPGKRTRLETLIVADNNLSQAGISVVVDGVTVINEKTLARRNAIQTTHFFISSRDGSGFTVDDQIGGVTSFTGNTISILKNGATTGVDIAYSFSTEK